MPGSPFFTNALVRLLMSLVGIGLLPMLQASDRFPVDYVIKRWVSSEQLPLTAVESLAQTQDGFIWFAMNGGLGRFDGLSLDHFNSQNTPEMSVSIITALIEDHEGGLWIGTAGGGILRWKANKFERFAREQGLENEQVKALALGPDGRLWIGTDGGGVIVRETDGSFRQFSVQHGLPEPFVVGLELTAAGELLALTFHHGVYVMGKDQTFRPVPLQPEPAEQRGLTLTGSKMGRVWLGSSDGVYEYQDGTFRAWAPGRDLVGDTPLIAWQTGPEELWLGTARSVIHWKNGSWKTYATGGAASPRMASAFLVDRENSIWISTEGGGLIQLRQTPLVTLGSAEGLAGDEITSVLFARDGSLWIGSTQGLTVIDDAGFHRYGKAQGLKDDCIFSLQEDNTGVVWVSTRKGGISRWIDGRFQPLDEGGASRIHTAWCLYRGRDGAMWAGTPIGAFQFRNGKLARVIDAKDNLSNSDVRCFQEDEDSVLWIGTSYGLNQVTASGVKSFTRTPEDQPIEAVVSIHRDTDGDLWIGTLARGLYRMAHGKFERFSIEDGLPDNSIFSITEDAFGALWIGTGRGLVRTPRSGLVQHAANRRQPLDIRVFKRADGLRSEEFTGTLQPVVARSEGGRLWFGTSSGLSTLSPSTLSLNRKPPLISLQRLALEGPGSVQTMSARGFDGGRLEARPIHEVSGSLASVGRQRSAFATREIASLNIPPGLERLEFQFVSPNFVAPYAVQYRFQLQGFDPGWVEAGNRRAAYYTRVPPGTYRFAVEARDESGIWSTAPATLDIEIEPAWYQWMPVRITAGTLCLGAMVGFFQIRIRRLRRQREQSAQFSRQLIRSQEKERTRIAGELHDGLGQELQLIRNRAEMALREVQLAPEVSSHLASISETAARSIDGVRAMSRGLRPPELDQLGLSMALRWLGKNVRESFEGCVEFDIQNIDGLLDAEQELDFYRIAQEALNNAVRHSAGTEITFEVQRHGEFIQLSVYDNGRGFSPQEASLLPRIGAGLTNMQERAELLQGTLELNGQPQTGTRLTLQVPARSKASPL